MLYYAYEAHRGALAPLRFLAETARNLIADARYRRRAEPVFAQRPLA
jgi:hypothetical protein